jgi:uncharacterized protein (DUF302 family)
MLLQARVASAEELLTVRSSHGVTQTLDLVEAAAQAKGFFIFARVNHAGLAEAAGLALRPTAVLIFGRPEGGTPLMQCDQRAGIDLPLRALAWQDQAGQVWLGMADPKVLKGRYGLDDACDGPVAAMQGAVRALLDSVRDR